MSDKKPRTEPVFVATYDFDGSAPRVAETVLLRVPGLRDGLSGEIAEFNLYDSKKARLVHDHLKGLGADVQLKAKEGHDLDPDFKERLRTTYKDIGLAVGYSTPTDPRIETPQRQGQAAHRERRAILERFLRAEGVAFTVECATLHSDKVCALVLDDERPRKTTGPNRDVLIPSDLPPIVPEAKP